MGNIVGSLASSVLGGGSSGQSSQTVSNALTPGYTQYQQQLNDLFSNPATAASAFTPAPLSSGETNAINNLSTGFTPTASSLNSDLSMLQNPFNSSVINLINQQANGQNSLVNQAGTLAGQQGSNRNFLGSSDVEQNRLNNIGAFQQSQYNQSLSDVLNNLVPQRQQDALDALTGGQYQRNIQQQTQLAPYNAMQSYGQLLGVLPKTSGSATNSSTAGTGGTDGSDQASGFGSAVSNISSILQLASLF